MANPFNLMISHAGLGSGVWSYPLIYQVDDDQDEVVFDNQALLACKVIFTDPSTFGTGFPSLAPESAVSVNLNERNSTGYVVVGYDESAPVHIIGPGRHTIKVNNAPLANHTPTKPVLNDTAC